MGRPVEPVEGGRTLIKVTVNLTPRTVDAMEIACARTGDSKTDTINRALQVYQLVLDLLRAGDGRSLVIRHPDGETERVYIL